MKGAGGDGRWRCHGCACAHGCCFQALTVHRASVGVHTAASSACRQRLPPPPCPSRPPSQGVDVHHCHTYAVSTSPAAAPPPALPLSLLPLPCFRRSPAYPLPPLAATLVAVFHLPCSSEPPSPPLPSPPLPLWLRPLWLQAPVAAVPSLFGGGCHGHTPFVQCKHLGCVRRGACAACRLCRAG